MSTGAIDDEWRAFLINLHGFISYLVSFYFVVVKITLFIQYISQLKLWLMLQFLHPHCASKDFSSQIITSVCEIKIPTKHKPQI